MYAKEVNDCYSFYNIKRTTSAEEKHINTNYKESNYKYKVSCSKCSNSWLYLKKTKVIRSLEENKDKDRFKCPYCGGKAFTLNYNI